MAARKSARKSAKKSVRKPTRKAAAKSAKKSARRRVPPVPKGIHSVTPMLSFQDTAFAIQFYEKAFGAKELYRLTEPSGKVGHAEMKFGDSIVMMGDEYPDMAVLSAKTIGGSPIRLSLAFKSADVAFERAVRAGATVIRPLTDEFYGWRSGNVMDPFGYTWLIMSQIEVLSPREMQKRWTKMLAASKPEAAGA
jgi:PhnB protein